jgi:hypothetical protein
MDLEEMLILVYLKAIETATDHAVQGLATLESAKVPVTFVGSKEEGQR